MKNDCIYITIDGKPYLSHRLAWLYFYGEFPKNGVRHSDNTKTNNRIVNLETTDYRGRDIICRHRSTSPFRTKRSSLPRGVYQIGPRFRTTIYISGKHYHIGTYDTVEEASAAYLTVIQNLSKITTEEFLEIRKELKMKRKKLKMVRKEVKVELTQERLKELLDYNPDTGEFKWRVFCKGMRPDLKAGSLNRGGYVYISVDGTHYRANRLAWLYSYGSFPKNNLSPINGIRHDIRITNLKEITKNECLRKAVRGNPKCELPFGVYRGKLNYVAKIRIPGKTIYIGGYNTVEDAEAAYLTARDELSKTTPEGFLKMRADLKIRKRGDMSKWLTQDRLKELLDYNSVTGIFTWKVFRSRTAKAGTRAGYLSKGYVYISVDGIGYSARKLAWLYCYGEYPKS